MRFHCCLSVFVVFFFFKQKTAYEMRISDWSSDVCSSDLDLVGLELRAPVRRVLGQVRVGVVDRILLGAPAGDVDAGVGLVDLVTVALGLEAEELAIGHGGQRQLHAGAVLDLTPAPVPKPRRHAPLREPGSAAWRARE